MTDPVLWSLDDHTRAKHKVLRAYLDAWLPIMGQQASKMRGYPGVVARASSCRTTKTVKRGNRRVRVPGESAIAWNQQGRPGLQGQAGSNPTIKRVAAGGDLTGSYPSPTPAAP